MSAFGGKAEVDCDFDRRQEFGHWEGDLLQFRTQRGNLLTLIWD